MCTGRALWWSTFMRSWLTAVLALALPAGAQSVISTHSGVIHFFDGNVYLGDQRLEQHLGKFPSMTQGSELRTAEGRAEVLLTPGVFLRVGELSAIRMISNSLADTRVELEAGSAIVDSGEPNPGTSVTLTYKDYQVHFLQKGVYRIDSDPAALVVREGLAEVSAGAKGTPVSVEHGMSLPFAKILVPEPSNAKTGDALGDWENGRSQSITADNAITAQIDEDPAAKANGVDSFTYFPFLGIPSMGLISSGTYPSINPYQAGFNSIYLPGYTYAPLMLGLMGRGTRPYLPMPTRRILITPAAGGLVPRMPAVGARPVPVRAAPPVVIHR
jgi:hypothetical protein